MANTEVTIEWQMTTQGYQVGDVCTVERTEFIDDLIERQVVVVVERELDEAVYPGGDTVPGSTPHAEQQLTDAPNRNAKRDEWAEFLTAASVAFTENDSRDDLVALWDAHLTATA
ncbi:hypothetical protein OG579_17110 [Williamsia herbipolensis]|uniref:Uncharacterized protein n=1 Tax=Williamsia herbipolensis TaxID=1603258 RepID=A0AAU4K096_9NOCA|nr:hypothetical protein [Williamsia herbipolensis]